MDVFFFTLVDHLIISNTLDERKKKFRINLTGLWMNKYKKQQQNIHEKNKNGRREANIVCVIFIHLMAISVIFSGVAKMRNPKYSI